MLRAFQNERDGTIRMMTQEATLPHPIDLDINKLDRYSNSSLIDVRYLHTVNTKLKAEIEELKNGVSFKQFAEIERRFKIYIIFYVYQLFIMRYYFGEFCCKSKVIWCSFRPILDHKFIRNPIEGRINLHEIKYLGIKS